MPTEYLTIKQAAARLQVCEATVRSRIKTGELPSFHSGRIMRVKFEANFEGTLLPRKSFNEKMADFELKTQVHENK